MKTTCRKIHENLVAFIDGEVAREKAHKIAEHVKVCPECQSEFKELQESMAQLSVWKDITLSDDYDRVFWQKLAVLKEKDKNKGSILDYIRSLVSQNFSVAASAALALMLVFMTFFQSRPYRKPPVKAITPAMDMELFLNLKVIEYSEALEHFELIEALDKLEKETRE